MQDIKRVFPEGAEIVVGVALALISGWAVCDLGAHAAGAMMAVGFSPIGSGQANSE